MKSNLDLNELERYSTINAVNVLMYWGDIESFNLSIVERMDVASRQWVTITFTRQSEEYIVDGFSIEIAKLRFFKKLRELGL